MRHYYYLIASLPMLEFGIKMPFSYDYFLSLCREHLAPRDMELIDRALFLPAETIDDSYPMLEQWKRFDTTLRNELAKTRAAGLTKDPIQYIRGEGYTDPFIASFAHWVVKQDSPLGSEVSLDRMRWEKIEELQKGHYFDIGFLIAYALELQLLARWQDINQDNGMQVLYELLEKSG